MMPSDGGERSTSGRVREDRRQWVSERVEEWLTTEAGAGALDRAEAGRDARTRRWEVVTPSATRIGRADSPENDLSESVRRLHDERHPATEGYSRRAHRLEKLRLTHALCGDLALTP